MSTFSSFQLSKDFLRDPEGKKFVNHFTDTLKVSVYQALYNVSKGTKPKYDKVKVGKVKEIAYDSVAQVVYDRFAADNKKEAVKNMLQMNGPKKGLSRSLFLPNTLIDYKTDKPVFQQLRIEREFGYVKDELFMKHFDGLYDLFKLDLNLPPTAKATKLQLKLAKVKCVDETDPDWLGSDEIAIGGFAVDEKSNESKIAEFKVGKFDDGDVKDYNPDKVLKEFLLNGVHPGTYAAFLSIAEKDSGGFSDFLQKLYEAVKAHVVEVLTVLGAAAGTAIGVAIGGSVGTALAGPIGAIIGIVAGAIMGALIGWLVESFKDDVFEPAITAVILENNQPFTGPVQRLVYEDYGAKYYAYVYWQAV